MDENKGYTIVHAYYVVTMRNLKMETCFMLVEPMKTTEICVTISFSVQVTQGELVSVAQKMKQ